MIFNLVADEILYVEETTNLNPPRSSFRLILFGRNISLFYFKNDNVIVFFTVCSVQLGQACAM